MNGVSDLITNLFGLSSLQKNMECCKDGAITKSFY